MRVIAIVNAKTGALCVQEIVDQGDEVVAVICLPEDPWPGIEPGWSVKEVATRNYLPVYQLPPREVNSPGFVEQMRKLKADMIVAMHYGVIFKRPLLDVAPRGTVNIHPTRLPRGQGMTPSCWHMLMGDEKNWITLHWIDEGIDTGPVIAQASVDILPTDTGHDSTNKLLDEGHRIFAENLPLLRAGKAPAIPQDQIEGVKRLYYRWQPEYARIPWDKSAEEVELHIRALCHPKETPTYSGEAYTYLGGKKVSVWKSRVVKEGRLARGKYDSGEILSLYGEGVLAKTGEGALLLTDIDVQAAAEPGLPGLLDLLRSGLSATFK
jgi:methionyl-tRNA formyltransferase